MCACGVSPAGEATLTDALTAAGKTYEEIAQMVAEQVRCSSQAQGLVLLHLLYLFHVADALIQTDLL